MTLYPLIPAAVALIVLAASATQAAAARRRVPQQFSPPVQQDDRQGYRADFYGPGRQSEAVSGSYGAVVHGYNPVGGAI